MNAPSPRSCRFCGRPLDEAAERAELAAHEGCVESVFRQVYAPPKGSELADSITQYMAKVSARKAAGSAAEASGA